MILILFFYRKKILGQEEKTSIEIERDTGYNQKASKIDRFTAGLLNKIKPKNKQIPNNPTLQPKTNVEDIHKKIDRIKQTQDAFQKTTVTDIQNIQSRVDTIETNLETNKAK